MGEALFDLEQVLMSKKEKLTPQEANILLSCKSKAVREFTASALAGATATWAATWKLSKPFRIYLSADHILTMDGSKLQKELANIMVTKYQNDPALMQLISKHFYSERIFDDSTTNDPKLRWRYRNFFSDNVVHGHRTHDHESYDKSQGDSRNDYNDKSQGGSENVTDGKRTNLEAKHVSIKKGPDILLEVDPFDCLFGYTPPMEEIDHSNTPNKPSGIHNRAQRRYHRRRRMRNQEDLSNSEYEAAV